MFTDVDITKRGEGLAELLDGLGIGLGLLSVGILGAALLLGMEAEVLKEDDLAVAGLLDVLLNLGADAVVQEGNGLRELLLELLGDGSKRVLGVLLAIGTAEVGHEDDGGRAVLNGILDGGESADDTLGVGDLVTVEGDVEVDLRELSEAVLRNPELVTYTDEGLLALEVDVGDSCSGVRSALWRTSGARSSYRACWRETSWSC